MTDKLINVALTVAFFGSCLLVFWALTMLILLPLAHAEDAPAPSPDRMCVGEYPDGSTEWVPCEWLKTREA